MTAPLYPSIGRYLNTLLPAGRPEQLVVMQPASSSAKYLTIKDEAELRRWEIARAEMFTQHASGASTYAGAFEVNGHTRIGGIDIDAGGQAALVRVLQVCQELGWTAYAVHTAAQHDGGYVYIPFRRSVPARDVEALMRQIAIAAGMPKAEILPRPSGKGRYPYGYHRRAETRGTLITQAGEVFDLDDLAELAAGFWAIEGIRNPDPPAAPPEPTPEPRKPVERTPLQMRPAREGESLIDRFNAEHTVIDVLKRNGAEISENGKLSTCPCGVDHGQEFQISIGHTHAYCHSDNPACKLSKDRYPRGLSAFDIYCALEHGGDVRAAVRELARTAQRPARSTEQYRAADAQRKREERAQQAAALRADVEARADADPDLSGADRAVLETLLRIAGDRGWCRPSKQRLAEMTGYSLGSVKRSLMAIEGRYIVSEGEGGGPNQTAVRTFVRGSCAEQPVARMIHESRDLDCKEEEAQPSAEGEPIPVAIVAEQVLVSQACELPASPSPAEPLAPRTAGGVLASAAAAPHDDRIAAPDDLDVLHGPDGAWCYPGGVAWLPTVRAELWHADLHPAPAKVEQEPASEAPQLPLAESAPTYRPASPLVLPREGRTRKATGLDAYRARIGALDDAALAGEVQKLKNTVTKHSAKFWVNESREKLKLAQRELDRRARAQPPEEALWDALYTSGAYRPNRLRLAA